MSDLSPFRLVEFGEMVEDEGEVYPTEPSLEVLPELYLGEYNLPHPLHASLLARLFTVSSILLPLFSSFLSEFFLSCKNCGPRLPFQILPICYSCRSINMEKEIGFHFPMECLNPA